MFKLPQRFSSFLQEKCVIFEPLRKFDSIYGRFVKSLNQTQSQVCYQHVSRLFKFCSHVIYLVDVLRPKILSECVAHDVRSLI